MSNWTFITNHGAVLALIAQHGQITTRDIAAELDITERTVHRVISDLDAEGYIERERGGRFNWYKVNHDVPLRRPEIQDIAVGELLKVLLAKERALGQRTPGATSGEPQGDSGVEAGETPGRQEDAHLRGDSPKRWHEGSRKNTRSRGVIGQKPLSS